MTSNSELPDKPLALENPTQLIRQMSHDMRVPLSTLISTGTMLIEGTYDALSPKQARAVQRMQRSSLRLLALVDDFATYVKAEAREYPLENIPFDPRALVTELYNQLYSAAAEKQLDMHLTMSERIPPVLNGDAAVIKRIIHAVLLNAVSFTDQGSISLEANYSGDNDLAIEIRDSGPGIPPTDVPLIFEPFWRGPERPQTSSSGFGLGLAMARALSKQMGGDLQLIETSAQGCLFRLKIPLATVKTT